MDVPHEREARTRTYAAPIMAIVGAIGSFACCLPVAFLAALGAASASSLFAALRPWLLALSAILLVIGFVRLYRERRSCRRRSIASLAVFWAAVTIFLIMLFFPQQIAGLLAGH